MKEQIISAPEILMFKSYVNVVESQMKGFEELNGTKANESDIRNTVSTINSNLLSLRIPARVIVNTEKIPYLDLAVHWDKDYAKTMNEKYGIILQTD